MLRVINCIPMDLFEGFIEETINLLQNNGIEATVNFLISYNFSDEIINHLIDSAERYIRLTSLTQEDCDAIGNEYIQEFIKNHHFIS